MSTPARIAVVGVAFVAVLSLLQKAGSSIAHSSAQFGGIASGRVLDDHGRPLAGVAVSAELSETVSVSKKFCLTDRRGEFVIQALPPGKYILHTRDEEAGYPRTEFNFYDAGEAADQIVEVRYGQPVQNVVIRLGPKAARLTGRVVDAKTNDPLRGVNITARRVDQPDRFLTTGLFWHGVQGGFNFLVPASLPLTLKITRAGYEDWEYKRPGNSREPGALRLLPGSTKELHVALTPLDPRTSQ
jgi:hypothetical protein